MELCPLNLADTAGGHAAEGELCLETDPGFWLDDEPSELPPCDLSPPVRPPADPAAVALCARPAEELLPEADRISVTCGEQTAWFPALRQNATANQVYALQADICARFEFGSDSAVVLRRGDGKNGAGGCVVPLSCRLAPGDYHVRAPRPERAALLAEAAVATTGLALQTAAVRSAPALRWVQRPPCGGCEWLTVSVSKRTGELAPARHVFDPPVAVVVDTTAAAALAKAEGGALETALPQAVRVSLWIADPTSGCLVNVSQFLHSGAPTLEPGAGPEEAVLRWPRMGISELPSKIVLPDRPAPGTTCSPPLACMGSATAQQRVAKKHDGGRGTTGCFHFRVDLPGAEPLWLMEKGGADGQETLGQIMMKHRRCCTTGRWMERGIGPYARHERCRAAGSHVSPGGARLCEECSCK